MSQLPLFAPPVLTISELTRQVKHLIESDPDLGDVWVLGEVSNFKAHTSGHWYFTLKDARASLRCMMWKNQAALLRFRPQDGDRVEAHGAVAVYEQGGTYQLYVDALRPAGQGELFQEFLRLQARLQAEGLFEAERKRPIPRWPQRIGIVTSPTGAALRDMLNTLRRRYPLAEVVLAPSAVQGSEAPAALIAALRSLNAAAQPDVILLARGGGSIEDLWAFNDEGVARAIAASAAPVITGVGHETDFTIADFTADLRAPTPTAAAELAVPNRLDLQGDLAELRNRLAYAARAGIASRQSGLARLEGRLKLASPAGALHSGQQRLDELAHRLESAAGHRLKIQHARLAALAHRLQALSPQAVLGRGYALVRFADGRLARRAAQIAPGDELTLRFADGETQARALPGPAEAQP